jgi:hypothetical protein
MAHAILVDEATKRSLDIDIYSAGVLDFSDQPPLDETSNCCLYYNTPPPKLTPTWVGQLPLDSIDRFLVMEQNHADALENEFGISLIAFRYWEVSIRNSGVRRFRIPSLVTVRKFTDVLIVLCATALSSISTPRMS